MKKLALASAIVAAVYSGPARSQDVSVQFIADASAVYFVSNNVDFAETMQRMILGYLGSKRNRSSFRDAELKIIHTSFSRTVFSADIPALQEGGGRAAIDAIKINRKGCNDLAGAFRELAYNIRNTRADEIYIIVLSSLVDTGKPCSSVNPYAPVPAGISAKEILADDRIEAVYFLGVVPEQKYQWLDAFDPVADSEGVDFELHDIESTADAIRKWRWP